MTQQEAASHWQERAHASLEAARALFHQENDELNGIILFHCHLAVELALKSAFIRVHDAPPPFTHDLSELADAVGGEWPEVVCLAFEKLTEFAILARYGDDEWYEKNATRDAADAWLKQAEQLISDLFKI